MHLHQILSRKWQKCVGTKFQGGQEGVRRWGRNSLFYSFFLWSLTMLVYLSTKINGLEQSHSKAFIVNQRKKGNRHDMMFLKRYDVGGSAKGLLGIFWDGQKMKCNFKQETFCIVSERMHPIFMIEKLQSYRKKIIQSCQKSYVGFLYVLSCYSFKYLV